MQRRQRGLPAPRGCSSEGPPSCSATRSGPCPRMETPEESSPWCTGSVSDQQGPEPAQKTGGIVSGGGFGAGLAGLEHWEEGWALSCFLPASVPAGMRHHQVLHGTCLRKHSKQWLGGCLENSPRGSSQRDLILPVVRGHHGLLQCTESLGKCSLSPGAGSMCPCLQTPF